MAQKIYPRSLRTVNQCASDFSFYSENDYASLWKKTTEMSMEFLSFCEKNLLYKKKNKAIKKSKNKRYKYKTFYKTRFFLSNLSNGYALSPILFKFHKQSLSNKYNPIKAMYKIRRSDSILKKKPAFSIRKNGSFGKSTLRSQKTLRRGIFPSLNIVSFFKYLNRIILYQIQQYSIRRKEV